MKEGRSQQRKRVVRKHHKPTPPPPPPPPQTQTEKSPHRQTTTIINTAEEGRNRKRKRVRKLLHHKPPHPQTEKSPPHKQTTIATNTNANTTLLNNNAADASSEQSRNSSKNSTFLDKMRAKLSGGHFRMINEKLYTCSGDEALNYFEEAPSLFDVYHAGYQEQMSHWPEQPVNIIIKWIEDHSRSLVVADFGCGDAHLARNVKNKVFSFDLVSNDPAVIACDMSNTPLTSSSVDVVVFCLSLMGTNFPSYLQEAHRVLKPCGWLLIAEVKSRFDPNNGGADPDRFSKAICELGFTSLSKDFSNKMFILLYFKKKEKHSSKKEIEWPKLKPCLYKRR